MIRPAPACRCRCRLAITLGLAGMLFLSASPSLAAAVIDLRAFEDTTTPLPNPHKGWYHHFPDNGLTKYVIREDADLLDFPGMDHLYLRLAWSYLEPKEGEFHWEVIDPIIEKWTGRGLGIAFRISCRETGTKPVQQQFATPRWVMEAGAKGGFYLRGEATGPEGPWEPDFGDPVFLEKLDRFLAAFATRYDGALWLRYVDIGSIGDWGEGHTWAGSRTECGYKVRKRHIDLHLEHFEKTQLVVTDDYVYALENPAERERLHRYVIERGITYRDDSILVNGYLPGSSKTYTVRSPEFFADAYLRTPTVLELEHYGAVKQLGNWDAGEGSLLAQHGGGLTGPDFFRGALGLLHATYIGYHGDAREWLTDNRELTGELLNRCGYWYFLREARFPDTLKPYDTGDLDLVWQNRGVAPAYLPFCLSLRLEGETTLQLYAQDAGNLDWLPDGQDHPTRYEIPLPASAPPGRYTLKFRLWSWLAAGREVRVALKPDLRDDEGYYRLGGVEVLK